SFGFPTVRRYFPDAKVYLVDDSGPALIGSEIPDGYRAAWYEHWDLGPFLDPICPDCRDDFSALIPAAAKLYPNDRMALLSSMRDGTISQYLLKSPGSFEAD